MRKAAVAASHGRRNACREAILPDDVHWLNGAESENGYYRDSGPSNVADRLHVIDE